MDSDPGSHDELMDQLKQLQLNSSSHSILLSGSSSSQSGLPVDSQSIPSTSSHSRLISFSDPAEPRSESDEGFKLFSTLTQSILNNHNTLPSSRATLLRQAHFPRSDLRHGLEHESFDVYTVKRRRAKSEGDENGAEGAKTEERGSVEDLISQDLEQSQSVQLPSLPTSQLRAPKRVRIKSPAPPRDHLARKDKSRGIRLGGIKRSTMMFAK